MIMMILMIEMIMMIMSKVMEGSAKEAVVGAMEMLEALHWLLKRPHQVDFDLK